MNYIDRVGFEIEGGWDGEEGISPIPEALIQDLSINGQTLGASAAISARHVGEAVSPPISYLDGPWQDWLLSRWPNAAPEHRTNRTCGFHIHLSTWSLRDYALLSSKTFLLQLRDEMIKLGKEVKLPKKHVFWERMEGKNTFCDFFFDPAQQLKITTKGIHRERYGWLNFSYGVHGTVEFRALPTFRDGEVALQFASTYFNLVNAFLEARKDLKLVKKLNLITKLRKEF